MLMDMQFDYIIKVNQTINEALGVSGSLDPRLKTGAVSQSTEFINLIRGIGPGSSMSVGGTVRNSLQMGSGYTTEVVDFGEVVTVRISYTNTKNGKSAGQNFAILFDGQKFNVKSTFARWRSCNDVGQAISYIRSRASSLSGKTSGQ